MINWEPFWLSLRVAGWGTILSVLIGLPVALLLSRRFRAKHVVVGLVNLPLVMSPTVLGYFVLVSAGRLSPLGILIHRVTGVYLSFTWQGAVAAVCLVSIPLFISNARVAFAAIDPDVVHAARVDGAGRWAVLWCILMPLARPGLAAGVTLAFARALGDFGATLMVAGDTPGVGRTMPVAIWDAFNEGDDATVRVFVLISIALSLFVCLLAARLVRD